MLGPLPVGLLGGTVEPPTFSGYYSGHTYGVLGLEWDDLEPLGVTGSGLTFSVVSGSLPPGLSLNPSTGVISGTPVSAGVNPVVVRCSNGAGDMYIVDTDRIRKISTGGVVTTVTEVQSMQQVVAVSNTTLYVSSPSARTIRIISLV